MKRQTERTRLHISACYTGAGSKKSVITHRPKRAFEHLKQLYQDELRQVQGVNGGAYTPLTLQQRQAIKKQVALKAKARRPTKILALNLAFLLTIALFIFAFSYIKLT